MRPENQSEIFSAQSPTDYNVNDLHKRSKISYIRDALISLSNLDKSRSPPEGFDWSIICEDEDVATLDSDSTSSRSSPADLSQNFVQDGILGKLDSVKVTGYFVPEVPSKSDHHLLHKSDEPYRPPHLFKKTSDSRKLEARKNSNVGYSDGIHHPELEGCNNLVHISRQSDSGTSQNCPSWRKPLEKGTSDELQFQSAHMTGFIIPGSSSTTGDPIGCNVRIEKGPKLNHDSDSDNASDSDIELNLPDEDSLHTFDDTYFVADKGERIGYEDFNVSPKRTSITDKSSGSSFPIDVDDEPPCPLKDVAERVAEHVLKDETPCSMIDMVELPVDSVLEDETLITLSPDLAEKLIGSVLDDEPRSPSPPIDFDKLVDSILDENSSQLDSVDYPLHPSFVGEAACLSFQKLHVERSYPQFRHMQLNPKREVPQSPSHGQVHGNTEIGPLRPSHLFTSSMISHPLHLFDGEQRRFKCKRGLPLLQLVPAGDTFPFSLHQRVQRESPPHLPAAFPMARYERELRPQQNFTAFQQPNYWVSPMANSGLHAYHSDYNNSQVAVNGLMNMRLRGMHMDT